LEIKGKDIVFDAYNVIVTVGSILCSKEIVIGMDGFLRGISAVFSSYRFTEKSGDSLAAIIGVIS
jgi:hypothetical protein